jgi:pyruvate dehydrogenase E2 component (dihydrolipoamide acetyltransferase)
MVEVHLPPLGDTVEEARITSWLKQVGEVVALDEPLLLVETDKVETEIPSPLAGVLTAQLVGDGDTVDIGSVVATLGATDELASPVATPTAPQPLTAVSGNGAPTSYVVANDPSPAPSATPVEPPSAPGSGAGTLAPRDNRVRTPLVRRLVAEHQLDPATITGSGMGGRITRQDVLAAVSLRTTVAPTSAPLVPVPPATAVVPDPVETPVAAAPASYPDDPHWQPFSRIRKVTGERMLLSATTIPQVTTVMKVDYENVYRARREHGPAFKKRTGQSLTYLPFVALAAVNAIAEFPLVNASVKGDGLRVHPAIHLGVAVDLDFQGLVVPVVRDAQELRLEAIAARVSDLAGRARAKRLGSDDLSGSTFTITNPGGYGTLAGTPLVNPPEVAILCLEGIAEEPVVVRMSDGTPSIGIHHVGHLSLSWDHRAIDGAYAAAFLARIRAELEQRAWGELL